MKTLIISKIKDEHFDTLKQMINEVINGSELIDALNINSITVKKTDLTSIEVKELDYNEKPISILDVYLSDENEKLLNKLEDHELRKYIDKDENLSEDLYTTEIIEQCEEEEVELTKEELAILEKIEAEALEKDCSYFRFTKV